MHALGYIAGLYESYESSVVEQLISPKDAMQDQWYWEVGASAISAISKGCISAGVTDVRKVLDLPCGHGRVLRHLKSFFPKAEIHACDLDKDGIQFCADTFSAVPVPSCENLLEMQFPDRYDLIWVGSLFTHTSRTVTRSWLAFLAQQLSEQGIVVSTFHGRWCEHVHRVAPYIKQESWDAILQQYRQDGYGYADYTREASHEYIEGSYGVSLSKPSIIISEIERIPGVRIYSYHERAWADHQDVLVFGKPSCDQKWPGM